MRRAAETAGELWLGSGPWESPLDPRLQHVLQQILDDGTYVRASTAVASDDPELACLPVLRSVGFDQPTALEDRPASTQ